jgi:hypothetical protein
VGLADERLLVRGGVNAAHRTLPIIWSARDKRRAVRGARHRFSSALGAEGVRHCRCYGCCRSYGCCGWCHALGVQQALLELRLSCAKCSIIFSHFAICVPRNLLYYGTTMEWFLRRCGNTEKRQCEPKTERKEWS